MSNLSIQPEIVIIGAGIAGLSAARKLNGYGFVNVKLLEAQKRTGGRIKTSKIGKGAIELGAQWIHGEGQNPLFHIARDNHLIDSSVKVGWDEEFRTQNGEKIDPAICDEVMTEIDRISDHCETFYNEAIPESCPELSLGEQYSQQFSIYLNSLKEDSRRKQLKKGLFDWNSLSEHSMNACNSLYDLHIRGWGQYKNFKGNKHVEFDMRGYQSIVDLFQDAIPSDWVHINKPVVHIDWKNHEQDAYIDKKDLHTNTEASNTNLIPLNAQLDEKSIGNELKADTCENTMSDAVKCDNHDDLMSNDVDPITKQLKVICDDETFYADHVITTVSLGCLKGNSRLFNPPLPSEKQLAVSNKGFGAVNKIYLEFSEAFWEPDWDGFNLVWLRDEPFTLDCMKDDSTPTPWYKSIHGFNTVINQPNILLIWSSGEGAVEMEKEPHDLVLNVCHDLMEKFLKKSIQRPINLIRTNWSSEPYVYGSYSYQSTHGKHNDVDILAAPLPNEKVPRLMFAGEATSKHYFSTVHGAMMSGWREADRLAQLYTSHD